MAATLDEAMGAVCWMNGHHVVAATITLSFLAMLPVETETIVRSDDRADRWAQDSPALKTNRPLGTNRRRGSGLFIVLKEEALRALTNL